MAKLFETLYKNKFIRNIYEFFKYLDFFYYNTIVKKFSYPHLIKLFSRYKIASRLETAKELAYSNKSFGRFGDGEISWILGNHIKYNSFEKNSRALSEKLKNVLNNNDNNFMIGIIGALRSTSEFTRKARYFWVRYLIKNGNNINKLLDRNKRYYNTEVTRSYIQYKDKSKSKIIFNLFKEIWNNKNVLVIEGSKSRIGFKDDLLSNARNVKRIECPSSNAFECLDEIQKIALYFLNNNKYYITLISLGPTATVLSYKLFMHGYRAIDIGQLDVEYDWFIEGATTKTNLPYKCVSEVPGGNSVLPYNYTYKTEIIYFIR